MGCACKGHHRHEEGLFWWPPATPEPPALEPGPCVSHRMRYCRVPQLPVPLVLGQIFLLK